ncbi:PAAR domain-containing protein [Salmonella enterica]|nr:PAAR domain-containing protein [Salmonella enterica]EJX5635028.1 PAAR domain-containing protein [Salmonella enterica]EMD3000688.1 PAAR domain-containing protein [Salmonella enterica]EMD3104865.1 PAAR domain-containing protein [Salmonella enterica]EMD3309559.1 PAAR domain-containing protein [Salmonella enterica]
MGKDAARQTADTAGHDGPITSGNSNVLTGGFPAARMGDTFVCKEHGPGVISEGSKTVTINGMPAARKGDKVVCGKKSLPPTQGPKPPEYHYVTIAKNTNKDGSVINPNGSNDSKTYVGYAVSALSDEDGDGRYDTSNLKAGVLDFRLSHPMGDSGANFNLGVTVGKAEMTAGTTSGEKGSSASFDLAATGLSGSVSLSAGTEGSDRGGVTLGGTLGNAEAKGTSVIIHDADEHQYGFKTELGAEAAVAKGDITFDAESPFWGLKVKGGISGTAGSIGLAGGTGVLFDKDDAMLRINLSGDIALGLGFGGDIEIQFGPFFNHSIGGTGIILSGVSSVIIGG